MIFDTVSPSVTDGKRWAKCVKDHAEGQVSLTAFTSLCRENKFMPFVNVCIIINNLQAFQLVVFCQVPTRYVCA